MLNAKLELSNIKLSDFDEDVEKFIIEVKKHCDTLLSARITHQDPILQIFQDLYNAKN